MRGLEAASLSVMLVCESCFGLCLLLLRPSNADATLKEPLLLPPGLVTRSMARRVLLELLGRSGSRVADAGVKGRSKLVVLSSAPLCSSSKPRAPGAFSGVSGRTAVELERRGMDGLRSRVRDLDGRPEAL